MDIDGHCIGRWSQHGLAGSARCCTLTLSLHCAAPSLCRSINSVGNTTSDASSAPVVVGRPGKVGKPVVQNGQTSFAVSFNPGEGLGCSGLAAFDLLATFAVAALRWQQGPCNNHQLKLAALR